METLTYLQALGKHPTVLKHYQPILLMSHMRANTSLLGHVLGSNPEIEGYYELHIGYYSWKSLIRQKLLHFAKHAPKSSARFMFDKVLHDDHFVDLSLFRQGKVIFALRPPQKTIRSIVSLYRSVEPDHPYTDSDNAAHYYISRIRSLAKIASDSPTDFLYLDADALREEAPRTLQSISGFLGLKTPLEENYKKQPLTGAEKAGDSSESIVSGKIERVTRTYDHIPVAEANMAEAARQFQLARNTIIQSKRCVVKVLQDE
tara:strand:- start:8268 stop:9047 length:780 start_codon:yes stop_codon:yes gene_type:complete